ncbi:homoprotocatechuate degradation operon regulator HpaR [Pacificoceanicola onchidii]|uniref:homoprotocatechuate degradation operon regulator HpaR n=1 Tax=Pacificoceanicola onchidii TaxID=2562685 RepID=UPI0010A6A20D|nr:homoprotocatechuate degradation operon regulator HpaR [Pacificoceanicola onchidii]
MPQNRSRSAAPLAHTRRALPIALLRARETLMERFRPMLHRLDVTEQQWRVLRVLDENEAVDATELAESAAILAPSLSRILKAMDARGFIHLRKAPDDGRKTLISLSKAGRDFLAKAAPESAAISEEIEARLGRDKIDRLLDEIDDLIFQLSEKR